MIFVYLSAAFLLGLSLVSIVAYGRAVRHGHRMYTHVVFAWAYVLVLTLAITVSIADESVFMRGVVVVTNLIGAFAMLNVVGRFRGGQS
jgi:hypothetical protein